METWAGLEAGDISDSCLEEAGLMVMARALIKLGLAVQDLNFYPF